MVNFLAIFDNQLGGIKIIKNEYGKNRKFVTHKISKIVSTFHWEFAVILKSNCEILVVEFLKTTRNL